MATLSCALATLLGAFGWTFAEYAFHNWVFHGPRGKTLLSREHLAHHARTSYFSPARVKALVVVAMMALISPVAIGLAGARLGVAFVAGFIASYLFYEHTHRRIHTHPPRNAYGRWVRRSHLYHHFHAPKMNHGVTTPLWDKVFRTYEDPGVISVPRKQLMPWLCDPETGQVRDEYAEDYVLRGGGRPSRIPRAPSRERGEPAPTR